MAAHAPLARSAACVLALCCAACGVDRTGPDAPEPFGPRTDAGPARESDAGVEGDAGAVVDAGAPAQDAGVNPADAGPAAACEAPAVDYTCVPGEPDTCPGGQCWFGSCVGAQVDGERFDGCGDGACAGCDADMDRETWCPADCAAEPSVPPRDLFDPGVLTVFVHGLHLLPTPTLMGRQYGSATDGNAIGDNLLAMDAALTDGRAQPDALRQLVGVEYYGDTPDPALAGADVQWIEELPNDTPDALFRYARVVAVFVRDRLALTGSATVNLLCHSMGCAVTRALIEHDLLALSSTGRIARVVGVSGAFQGARMAHMIDNPYVQQYAGSGAFNIWDIAALDPDAVRARVASWDHDLESADNPMWRGVLVHTLGGSDPTLDEAFNLFSLGAIHNPDDLPHDGVVFSFESLFARQDEANQVIAQSGAHHAPTHGFLDLSHNEIVAAPGTATLVHAALFSRRFVRVTLASVTLLEDLENGLQPGSGDNELVLEQRVFLDGVLVDERKLEDRTPQMWTMGAGETQQDVLTIFEGLVGEDASTLTLELSLVEVDRYRRYGLEESLVFDKSDPLLESTVELAVEDGELVIEGSDASAMLRAAVLTL